MGVEHGYGIGTDIPRVKEFKTPIIASDSGFRAVCGAARHLDDDQLRALAKNGGGIRWPGGGVDGYNCALEAITVTRELVECGHTEPRIAQR